MTMTSQLNEKVKVDRFAHLNQFHIKSKFTDSGNLPPCHYDTRISRSRRQVRSLLLPLIHAETSYIHQIQQSLRCTILDYYFAYSANLAAHTFYVLMLPLPIWFGYGQLTRTLVFILGYGIYFSGYVKDWCCLPRPQSPPVYRVTLSGYTAREYGFPSSHSANATAVSALMAYLTVVNYDSFSSSWWYYGSLIVIAVYYFTLICGRVYCGMHGFSDIFTGSLIGLIVLLVRLKFGEVWDDLILYGSVAYPLLAILFNYALIHYHCLPVDDCPCFDDSVAFIGVIMGIEAASWWFVNITGKPSLDLPYSYAELGLVKSVLRMLIGVGIVVLWKECSKPLLIRFLAPIYRWSYGGKEPWRDVITFNKVMSRIQIRDSRLEPHLPPSQPTTLNREFNLDPDYVEALTDLQDSKETFKCSVFREHRYDLEIVVRLVVYAGISWVSIVTFSLVTELVGLVPSSSVSLD